MVVVSQGSMERPHRHINFGGHQIEITCDRPSAFWDFVIEMTRIKTANGQDDAFYVMDTSCVIEQLNQWKKLMPKIQPYYAVKANPDPLMLKLLASMGVNFDCASRGEIETILSLGIPPERIIYANTTKSSTYIQYAKTRNVKLMTFDNLDELLKVKKFYPEADLVLRIAIIDYTALSLLSKKFGAQPKKAPELLHKAAELGLKVVGVSFHVGGGSKNPGCYAEGIYEAKKLFDIGKAIGHPMRIVDIGGGYPGWQSQEISLRKIAWAVNKALQKEFPNRDEVEVIAEPGRYFSMAAFTLATNVIARNVVTGKDIIDTAVDTDEGYMYYINDGTFGSFNCVPSYKIHPPCIAISKSYENLFWSRIWGPTCDSADVIHQSLKMPKLDVGDWIVFDFMGCYTKCISSEFNGFHCPETFYIVSEKDEEFMKGLQVTTVQKPKMLAVDDEDSGLASENISSATTPDSA